MAKEELDFATLWTPTPTQLFFKECVKRYKFILYGGAMGGGKSHALRWIAVWLLLKWAGEGHKNVSVGLFCEDYPSLEDRHIKRVRFDFPAWLGTYIEKHHEFRIFPEFGGGTICFRNLDDASKYKSAEFAAIIVDELTMNSRDVFDMLRTRMRWPGISEPKFIAASNPGGPGHAWVYKMWMLHEFDPQEKENQLFMFVPATARDNPHLAASYYTQLEGLPEEKRRAYLEGDWTIFEGQYFTEWRDNRHVIAPFDIPDTWFKYRSIDFGRTAPFCCKWYAVDYDGNIFVYREYYAAGLDADVNFRRVHELSRDKHGGIEQYQWTVLDSACFSATSGASYNRGQGETIADIAWREKVEVVPSPKDRIHGWGLMHQALQWQTFTPEVATGRLIPTGEKKPKLQYFSTCRDSIRTIPSLVYDKIHLEDLNTKGEDHAADTDRYFLHMLWGDKPKVEKKNDPKEYEGNVASRIRQILDTENTSTYQLPIDPMTYGF